MYNEAQVKDYIDDLQHIPLGGSIVDYLKQHSHDQNFSALLEYCCNSLLDMIQCEYYKYDNSVFQNSVEIRDYIQVAEFIKGDTLPYYVAVAEFFKGNYSRTFQYISKAKESGFFTNGDMPFSDVEFANCFLGPFKSAFPGFWEEIYKLLSSIKVEKGVLELCKAIPIFYASTDSREIQNALEGALAANPDSVVVKELLAITLYEAGFWGSAVSLFEQLNNEPIILYQDHLYFCMGWCYGKLNETKNEIEAYKKSAEIYPAGYSTMNNLGYAYYKAKQYNKALDCFRKCIDNNWEIKLAANNLVRTLLVMGRYKDAKDFVKSSPAKIHKSLLDRVTAADNTNKRIRADRDIETLTERTAPTVSAKEIDIGVKKQQFTNEKILEDELTLRIEAGVPVFGKQLKIYRRKGIYGRQYILSNGKRPDLLAEDADGNLYVIELKKDSGYDDAYAQIVDYLEWFDRNWRDQVNEIYGIICLNSPTQELLDKVHGNDRVRIFEYQISYTEL